MALFVALNARTQISSFSTPSSEIWSTPELIAQAHAISRRLADGEAASLSPADLNEKIVKPLAEKLELTTAVEGDEVMVSSNKEGEVKLLSVRIRAEGDKKLIEMSNTDATRFPAYRNNHALYSRGLISSDTIETVSRYVEEKLDLFHKSSAQSKLFTVQEVAEDLRAHIVAQGEFDVSVKQPKPHFALIIALRTASDPNYKFNRIAVQVRVHNIDADTVGINVVQLDREYEARVPKSSYTANSAEIKKIITDLLSQKTHLTLTVEKVIDSFSTIFAPHCNGKQPSLHNMVKEGAIYGALLGTEPNCALQNLKIIIEQFNYGYLQYVHLILDHSLMRAEYMIGIDPKVFEDNLKHVLDEVDREISKITKLKSDSQKEFTVTLEAVEEALKEAMGDGITWSREGETLVGKQGEIVVCKAVKSEQEKYWKISFMTPFGKKPTGASNPELFIEEKNGFDQLDRLKEHAKQFADDIKLV